MDERIINVERGTDYDHIPAEVHADPWEQEDAVSRRFWRNALLAVLAFVFVAGFGLGKVVGQTWPEQLALGETKNYAITACHDLSTVEHIISVDNEMGVQYGAATFHRLVRSGQCFVGILSGRFTEHISSVPMSGRMSHLYVFVSGDVTLIAFSSVPPEELGI